MDTPKKQPVGKRLPIEFGTKGMSYFPVSLGLQGDMWWFKPEYFINVLEWGYGKRYPGKKFPIILNHQALRHT